MLDDQVACAAIVARVFLDTGVLLAMTVFPRDQHGQPTLAGEVLELYEEEAFVLLSQAVIDELEEVIDRDFPEYRRRQWVVNSLAALILPIPKG